MMPLSKIGQKKFSSPMLIMKISITVAHETINMNPIRLPITDIPASLGV